MGAGEHQVGWVCDHRHLGLGIGAPKNEDQGFFPPIEFPDDPVCELLLAFAPVGVRLSPPDR